MAARLDGTSLFDGLVPGAISPVSGIVTLLMTARILAKLAEQSSNMDSSHGNLHLSFLTHEKYLGV